MDGDEVSNVSAELGRDAVRVADLFGTQVPQGGFTLADDPAFLKVGTQYGFLSGSSTAVWGSIMTPNRS